MDNLRKEDQQCRKKQSRGFDIRLEMSRIFARLVLLPGHAEPASNRRTYLPHVGTSLPSHLFNLPTQPAASKCPNSMHMAGWPGLLHKRLHSAQRTLIGKSQNQRINRLLVPVLTHMLKTWGRYRELLPTRQTTRYIWTRRRRERGGKIVFEKATVHQR